MAERKSVNKYYPPDWDPSKGSVNKYVGQHPLRDRARKLSQGILIIRFEMPYNIWCGGCGNHIGMGVRYNAEKSKTGNYYTTPIYKFRMKCHLCDNHFEIQTDPKNHDYVILNGARRKEQRWDPKENEQIQTEDKATQKKMATDPMFKLEHGSDDVKKGHAAVISITNLEGIRDSFKDDYILNKLARQKFRTEKKSIKAVDDSDKALLAKSSLDIALVKESEQDVRLAGLMKFRAVDTFDEKRALKRKEIEDRPLFQTSKRSKTETAKSDNKLDIIKKSLHAKASRYSPFSKGNSPSSTINKPSLGIRRKSVSSPASDMSDTQTLDNADTVKTPNEEAVVSNTMHNEDSSAVDSQNIQLHKEPEEFLCHEIGSTATGTVVGGSNQFKTTEDEHHFPVERKDVEETLAYEVEPSTDTNDVKLMPGQSVFCSNDRQETLTVTENDKPKTDKTKDLASSNHPVSFLGETDKNNSIITTNNRILKPGLSLISSYSDSDTDSNT